MARWYENDEVPVQWSGNAAFYGGGGNLAWSSSRRQRWAAASLLLLLLVLLDLLEPLGNTDVDRRSGNEICDDGDEIYDAVQARALLKDAGVDGGLGLVGEQEHGGLIPVKGQAGGGLGLGDAQA